jgi:hypothetical protein
MPQDDELNPAFTNQRETRARHQIVPSSDGLAVTPEVIWVRRVSSKESVDAQEASHFFTALPDRREIAA